MWVRVRGKDPSARICRIFLTQDEEFKFVVARKDITCWLSYSFELTDVSPSLMGHMAYPAFGMADWFPARAGLPILILMF